MHRPIIIEIESVGKNVSNDKDETKTDDESLTFKLGVSSSYRVQLLVAFKIRIRTIVCGDQIELVLPNLHRVIFKILHDNDSII